MAQNPSFRLKSRASTLLAGAAITALLLTSCSPHGDSNGNNKTAENGEDTGSTPTSSVAVEDDGLTKLPLYLVGSAAYTAEYPDDSRTTLTCGEAMVLVNTVPVKTEEPVQTALEFLLGNEQYYHGEPQLLDPLKNLNDVTVKNVTTESDAVRVELSGTIVNPGWCQAAQLVAQLEMTAAAAAGGKTPTITLDGANVRQALGVEDPYGPRQDPHN
ncbi:hypothetical protein [Micrococcoides hystricis]|uniref:GerMN domain-containing protein n=1 Tax=Micrococcoides hystricis TaxID=1572761 RepID=A0ABV6PCK7_9MICC